MDEEVTASRCEAPLFAGRETLPPRWDADLVGKRLTQSFVTLGRLPRVRGPRAPGGHWPRTVTEWADQLAQAEFEESERRTRQQATNRPAIRPSAAEITQMETAFDWLSELREENSELGFVVALWASHTASGISIKKLCAEKQWAPHTFWRRRAKALGYLAGMLNARGVPVVLCTDY